jgi:hypothetical protein
MNKILKINPDERLGNNKGISELKKHPWFANVDWNKIENQ